MTLRPYADRPLRLTGQLIGDVTMLAWAAVWVLVARWVHDAIVTLGTAGFRMRDGAGGVASHLRDAGADAARIPLAGDTLASPFNAPGSAATTVADAGQQLGDGVTGAALPVAVAIVAMTVLPLAVPWLLLRLRYARRAGATAELAGSPGGVRLLALRAMANAPARRLAAVDDDPVAAWNREDRAVVAALAALELRRQGLRG